VKTPNLFGWLLLVLTAITILTKSTGALGLGVVGAVVLFSLFRVPTRLLLALLVLAAPCYVAARTTGRWTAADLVPVVEKLGEDRAGSFRFRLINEDRLMVRAFDGPTFGWGGWGRNYDQDRFGRNVTIPDGLWIATLGERGIPGLVVLHLALLLPVVRFLWTQPVSTWASARCAAATACAVVVTLYVADNLMNNMHNPVFIMMAGALAGLSRRSVPKAPGGASITDPNYFRKCLLLARQRRARLQKESAAEARSQESGDKPEAPARGPADS
jgi:O-antigen ligase